jgi:divalent metal cation (Fe/Co/Zn/Cd) transporter
MELKDLYGLALMIVIVAMVIGVGLIVFAQLESNASTGMTQANQNHFLNGAGGLRNSINSTGTALGGISTTWLGLIITISILAIIIGLVISSFGGQKR